jgi:hypothetical protein
MKSNINRGFPLNRGSGAQNPTPAGDSGVAVAPNCAYFLSPSNAISIIFQPFFRAKNPLEDNSDRVFPSLC